ncbi:hypothetical protein CLCAR_0021 [Clostridium carboxidivorans P7]|nr:hypothetical protein CLCAR_0021 [Clostridium carboxidivorans P7]
MLFWKQKNKDNNKVCIKTCKIIQEMTKKLKYYLENKYNEIF